MSITPFIPETAPFSPDQRAWLNGFLAGMFRDVPVATVATKTVALRIAVLYASQTGTSEGLARKIAKELTVKGYAASLASLDNYSTSALAREEHALIVASTYGEGEAPEGAKAFYDHLCVANAPRLEKLSYAVLALGDRNYEQFCKFGSDLDVRLESLGARRMCHRVECDVDVDTPFVQWKTELLSRLEAMAAKGSAMRADAAASPAPMAPSSKRAHTRSNPLSVPLIEKKALTKDVSSKLTLHLGFSVADSGLRYEAGDACGVVPQNDPRLVAEILEALKFSGSERVEVPSSGASSLYDALLHSLQITRLNRKMVQAYATKGGCQGLLDLLVPEQQSHLDQYIYDRGLIDLLVEYPGVLTRPDEVTGMLSKLAPRLYSISSSPIAHAGEVHATVAIVRYRAHNMERGGVCSTLFADRVAVGDTLPIYIQPNKKFRLPGADVPMIMIGPGTGIAPFRAFLHERRALGCTGRNWLFFGERSVATDFLYREELDCMVADRHLTRFDTAFSRDQERKIYVQDRMIEQAGHLWKWLQDGASVYVCGDAARMAKGVDAALHAIVEREGNLDQEAAKDYVQQLKDEHRYHRDVY